MKIINTTPICMAGCNATSGFGGPSFGGLGNSAKWAELVCPSLLWSSSTFVVNTAKRRRKGETG